MKDNNNRYTLAAALFLVIVLVFSCSGRSGNVTVSPGESADKSAVLSPERLIKMVTPDENAEIKLGSIVKIVLEPEDMNLLPDSVVITFDGKYSGILKAGQYEFSIAASRVLSTGRKSIKASSFRNGKAGNVVTRFIIVYSDTPPRRYGYRVVNTYPHDRGAFTQGLFFYNGLLYEGTGQQTGSTLREVELTTGKVLRILNLNADLFGEGITLYRDRIYQVTWQSKVGFVYERSTFRQIKKIYYQTEGWGLTTIGDQVVMSDGTNVIYFFEPESFTIVSRIEVYDNVKKVDQLNELEYINGEIWANIWMTDLIARIDPASGKVIGYIDLKGLLKEKDMNTDVDVLNGIAYDAGSKRIFVTGKNWPKLFEITVTE